MVFERYIGSKAIYLRALCLYRITQSVETLHVTSLLNYVHKIGNQHLSIYEIPQRITTE